MLHKRVDAKQNKAENTSKEVRKSDKRRREKEEEGEGEGNWGDKKKSGESAGLTWDARLALHVRNR